VRNQHKNWSHTTRKNSLRGGPPNAGGAQHGRRVPSQNFLADPATVGRIVRAARLGPGDLVVEVGAGEGFLTRALARECGKIVAYEIDAALAKRLAARCRSKPKIECVHADFLSVNPPQVPFALVGNIPFAITSEIVDWCLRASTLTSATVVTQLEYARKRTGAYGRWSMVTVRTWPWFDWRLLGTISRERFRHVPAVDSGILRLERRPEGLLPEGALPEYEDFVTAGFGGTGGSLHASLSGRYAPARVTAAFRAAELSPDTVVAFAHPDQWVTLFTEIHLG
jgi:23S rRNA (adenine-N6)-dimethyltransferase